MYNSDELEKRAVNLATANECIFITDVITLLRVSRETFYNHNLDKSESLKEIIESNRVSTKQTLREKWLSGDNATLQIALYKLCSNETELRILSNTQRNENVNLNVNVDGDFSQLSEKEKTAKIEHLRRCLE